MSNLKEFGLCKQERLCGEKEIERLFTHGQKLYCYPFRIVYIVKPKVDNLPVRLAVSVPKRNFKRAVKRNYIKRRMREAYRLNKFNLYSYFDKLPISINLMLIYSSTQVHTFEEIEKKICVAFKQLKDVLQKNTDLPS